LTGDSGFSAPVSNDGAGNILWSSGAISTFAALSVVVACGDGPRLIEKGCAASVLT